MIVLLVWKKNAISRLRQTWSAPSARGISLVSVSMDPFSHHISFSNSPCPRQNESAPLDPHSPAIGPSPLHRLAIRSYPSGKFYRNRGLLRRGWTMRGSTRKELGVYSEMENWEEGHVNRIPLTKGLHVGDSIRRGSNDIPGYWHRELFETGVMGIHWSGGSISEVPFAWGTDADGWWHGDLLS